MNTSCPSQNIEMSVSWTGSKMAGSNYLYQNGGPPNKRRKFEDPVEMTIITDVNNKCLEYIFKPLILSDLLNISDAMKSLNNAASLSFAS